MAEKIDIRDWLTNPFATGREPAPLTINVTNWTKFVGEDWSSDLEIRFDGHKSATAELSAGYVEENGQFGYVAMVDCDGIEPYRQLFMSLSAAMSAAEEFAIDAAYALRGEPPKFAA